MQSYPSNQQLSEMMRLITQARIENWLGEDLGSWRWWILAMLLVVPWLIWAKLADRKQIHDSMLFGCIVAIATITLDELGNELSLWGYPVKLVPVFPRLTAIDYSVLPVVYMLTYQYSPNWKSFFWTLTGVAFVFSFVVEPIIVNVSKNGERYDKCSPFL